MAKKPRTNAARMKELDLLVCRKIAFAVIADRFNKVHIRHRGVDRELHKVVRDLVKVLGGSKRVAEMVRTAKTGR